MSGIGSQDPQLKPMSDRDRNAADEGRRAQPWLNAAKGESSPARIVLIESPNWLRDCLAYTLTTLLCDVTIEGVNSVDEVAPGPAQLLLIGLDPRSGCEPARLRDVFETLRRVGDGSPIGAYLHADNAAVAASLATLGVAGIVMPSANLEIAVASVRLMAAGGTFLPAGLFGQRDERAVSARPQNSRHSRQFRKRSRVQMSCTHPFTVSRRASTTSSGACAQVAATRTSPSISTYRKARSRCI